jgi:hypothetical protein
MSKLAQLAAARRAAAAGTASATPSSSTPITPVRNLAPSEPMEVEATKQPEVSKPLSKLAQRVAAAKAAKLEAETREKPLQISGSELDNAMEEHTAAAPPSQSDMEIDAQEADERSPLFSFPEALQNGLPSTNTADSVFPIIANSNESSFTSTGPSIFFSILTARPKDALVAPEPNETQLEAVQQFRNPFDEPSPDDLITKAREGTTFAKRQ